MLITKTKALTHDVLSGSKSTTSFMEDLWEQWLGEWRGKMGKCLKVGAATCVARKRTISVNCKILSNVIIVRIIRCRPGQKMRLTGKCRRV